jgi:heme oxygenase
MISESALSSRLRSETKAAHTAAERSGVMGQLLRGNVDRPTYVRLLQNLSVLYHALESEIDRNSDNPALISLDLNVLRRFPLLQNDIAALSLNAESLVEPESATLEYANHLHELGARSAHLLFAHAYLRYLGDLYGGQIMKGIVDKAIGASANNALTFYDFPKISNMSAFKNDFRNAIDALGLSATGDDAMVAEALHGYELHSRMFREVGERIQR